MSENVILRSKRKRIVRKFEDHISYLDNSNVEKMVRESPLATKTPIKKEKRKKKIRSSEEFLSLHKTPLESRVLKSAKKKTFKKPRAYLDLPEIDDIEGPLENKENVSDDLDEPTINNVKSINSKKTKRKGVNFEASENNDENEFVASKKRKLVASSSEDKHSMLEIENDARLPSNDLLKSINNKLQRNLTKRQAKKQSNCSPENKKYKKSILSESVGSDSDVSFHNKNVSKIKNRDISLIEIESDSDVSIHLLEDSAHLKDLSPKINVSKTKENIKVENDLISTTENLNGTFELEKSTIDKSLLLSIDSKEDRKSVTNRRNTFDLEKSSIDVELLPNIDDDEKSKSLSNSDVMGTSTNERHNTFDLEKSTLDNKLLPNVDEKIITQSFETSTIEAPKITERRATFEMEQSTNDFKFLPNINENHENSLAVSFSNNIFKFGKTPKSIIKSRGCSRMCKQVAFDDDTVDVDNKKPRKEKTKYSFLYKNDLDDTIPPWNNSTINNSFEFSGNLSDDVKLSKLTEENKKNNTTFELEEPTLTNTPIISSKKSKSVTLPSNTSTPCASIKNKSTGDMLKGLLSKDQSVTFNKSALQKLPINKSTIKKKTPGTKIPNFALIHKRAFERMESLEDHIKRKEERAKVLLSGKKPISVPSTGKFESSLGSRQKVTNEHSTECKAVKSKKQLCFGNSLLNYNTLKVDGESNMIVDQEAYPATEIIKISPKLKEKSPNKKIKSPINKPKISKEKIKSPNVNVFKFKIAEAPKNGYTRFGFKVSNPNKITKKDEIVAVANKTRIGKNDTQQRRDIIKGVRSNRRFDLLMKMRSK